MTSAERTLAVLEQTRAELAHLAELEIVGYVVIGRTGAYLTRTSNPDTAARLAAIYAGTVEVEMA
jgi:hypothetical protein